LKRNTLSDVCEQIVMEVLEKKEDGEVAKFTKILEDNKITMVMFVNEYSNYALSRKNPKYSGLEQDRMNIVQWALFYNKVKIVEHVLSTFEGDRFHLGKTIKGD
jgi:hypothetical protein